MRYINSAYDSLSYLYMPEYRFVMLLDAAKKELEDKSNVKSCLCEYKYIRVTMPVMTND
jgi:hypothetical protein